VSCPATASPATVPGPAAAQWRDPTASSGHFAGGGLASQALWALCHPLTQGEEPRKIRGSPTSKI